MSAGEPAVHPIDGFSGSAVLEVLTLVDEPYGAASRSFHLPLVALLDSSHSLERALADSSPKNT